MTRLPALLLIGLVSTFYSASSARGDDAAQLRPFLEEHCFSCHDPESKKGGLDLSQPVNWSTASDMALWVRLHDRVAKGEMPPGKRKPPEDEKAAFLKGLSAGLTAADAAHKGTVLRRLNRLEYENTLHDLLGIRTPLAELLPEDGKAHGFDTIGSALDLSAAQLQKYLQAADLALTAATQKMLRPKTSLSSYHLDDSDRNKNEVGRWWLKRPDGAVVVFNNGRFPAIIFDSLRIQHAGEYRLRLKGYAYQSHEPVSFGLYTTSRSRESYSTLRGYYAFGPGEPQTLELNLYLNSGDTVRLMPELSPGGALNKVDLSKYPGAGLAILSLEVEGPILTEWPPRGHRLLWGNLPVVFGKGAPKKAAVQAEILATNPAAEAERLLKGFAAAAFRRPVSAADIEPYLQLAKAELAAGLSFEQALRAAYTAVLCSPRFLYLIEPAGRLDDYAIASRLSYFLWRSMPDAELLAAAERRELSSPTGLRTHTERLLRDPKSQRFVTDFIGLWLNLREIEFTIPDVKLYPDFDTPLLHAMVGETEGFFATMLRENRPITDFLHSDWTILNERLAKHYGIPGVKGPQMREVKLPPDSHRGGILTHASILKVSANGTTTSPVTRGAWVMERILGEPPPPPPPGVPGIEPDIRGATTIREQLDKHRSLPTCAGCHIKIDPPGFALEHFDVIGGWRDRYRAVFTAGQKTEVIRVAGRQVALGPKVDGSGQLADGRSFSGPDDFKQLLLGEPDRFARALTEKLATFATGREMGFSDRPAIAAIVAANAKAGRGFRDLILRIVESDLFLTR